MRRLLTIEEITNLHHPVQYYHSPSTVMEEMDKDKRILPSLHIQVKNKALSRQSITSQYSQSITNLPSETKMEKLSFKISRKKKNYEEIPDEDIATELLQHDYITRIAPKKKYKLQANVKSLKKGTLRWVETEDISYQE